MMRANVLKKKSVNVPAAPEVAMDNPITQMAIQQAQINEAQPTQEENIAAALNNMGVKADPQGITDLVKAMRQEEYKEPERDWNDFLLNMGLKMMEEGGKPGATFFGSVGAGGSEALRQEQGKRKQSRDEWDKEQDARRSAIDKAVGLYTGNDERQWDRGMDTERLGIDKERLDMTRDQQSMANQIAQARLDIDRQNAGRGRYQTIDTGNGIVKINLDTGIGVPITMEDGSIVTGKPQISEKDLMNMAVNSLRNDLTGEKTLEQAYDDVKNLYQKDSASQMSPIPQGEPTSVPLPQPYGSTTSGAGMGGMGGGGDMINLLSSMPIEQKREIAIRHLKSKGMSDAEIARELKKQ